MGTSNEMGPRGKLIFCLVILLIGLSVQFLLSWALWRDLAPSLWDETVCTVRASSIVDPATPYDTEYRVRVEYAYEHDGVEHVSTQIGRSYTGDSDYRTAFELEARLAEGAEVPCFVDPDDPSEAVLVHRVAWSIVPIMLLPLLFIFFGIVGLVGWWRRHGPGRRRHGGGGVVLRRGGTAVGLAFFGVFLAAGLLFLYFGMAGPMLRCRAATGWDAVPCTVLSVRYVAYAGDPDDPTEYSPDIVYSYRRDGREYRSNTWDFAETSWSDPETVEAILAEFPAGETRTCFVNPDDPGDAVLDREFDSSLWLMGLFALPFLAIGAWGILRILLARLRR